MLSPSPLQGQRVYPALTAIFVSMDTVNHTLKGAPAEDLCD